MGPGQKWPGPPAFRALSENLTKSIFAVIIYSFEQVPFLPRQCESSISCSFTLTVRKTDFVTLTVPRFVSWQLKWHVAGDAANSFQKFFLDSKPGFDPVPEF